MPLPDTATAPSDGAPHPAPARGPATRTAVLGDFSATPRLGWMVPVAVVIGIAATGAAVVLVGLIGLITNLAWFGRLSVHPVAPSPHTLGPLAIVIPAAGGLVVGLMARFGSEQIRGHGIPETIDSLLARDGTVRPRLALLKPLASAIAIGTGGPFGAEGPIIVTGGALGSITGQLLPVTAAQRRTLLVAGAAAGMSAIFGTPLAAVVFAVELLAFELRPRSIIPVGVAAVTADGLRMLLARAGVMAPQPLFPVPAHPALDGRVLLGAVALGTACGFGAWLVTGAVHAAEAGFGRLDGRLHWMWWPALGGLVIGAGGLIDPRALGVGYSTIHAELLGRLAVGALVVLFVVKLGIWAVGLGSGTSGGILAPTLMLGAAIGGVAGHLLPGANPAVWALVGMGALVSGTVGAPLTAVVFSLELTGDLSSVPALLAAALAAYLIAILVMPRSILTAKVARRGIHVVREYGIDPLETLMAGDWCRTRGCVADTATTAREVLAELGHDPPRIVAVADRDGHLAGIVSSADLAAAPDASAGAMARAPAVVVAAAGTLRAAADRMAHAGLAAAPVIDGAGRPIGILDAEGLLAARARASAAESIPERVLRIGRRR